MAKIEVTHPDKTTITFEMCPYEDSYPPARSLEEFRIGDEVVECNLDTKRVHSTYYTIVSDIHTSSNRLFSKGNNRVYDSIQYYTSAKKWYLVSDFDANGCLKSISRPQKRIQDLEVGEYFEYDGEILYRVPEGDGKQFRALSISPRLITIPSNYDLATPLGKLYIKNSEQIGSPR